VATEPWSFPSARVTGVPPIVLGLHLAQGDVVRGAIVSFSHHEPIAYVQTRAGRWLAASIAPGSVGVIEHELAGAAAFTRDQVAQAVGDGQPGAWHADGERCWVIVGLTALAATPAMVIQRRRWRSGPWPAAVAENTVQAIARIYGHRG